MALIVSPGQNEIEQMKSLGLDIVPHRQRMNYFTAIAGRQVQRSERSTVYCFFVRYVADRV